MKATLVRAIRMLERAGIVDFNGHASARLPGRDAFLINSGANLVETVWAGQAKPEEAMAKIQAQWQKDLDAG